MKITIEHVPVEENEVILRCPVLDQEMLRVLSLLRSRLQKLCVWDASWEGASMVRRTTLWALVCNLGFIGGAAAFGWFSGVPAWAAGLLILVLECGLAAMWFAMHVVLKKDTEQLNRKLQKYKNENGVNSNH